jgi:hypothetical protein
MGHMSDVFVKQADSARGKINQDKLAEAIIRNYGDDPRAAVFALLRINSMLLEELHALACTQAYERLTVTRH